MEKTILRNAALAFDKDKVIIERLATGKAKSLDLLIRKTLIDNSECVQVKTQKNPLLSLNRQLELLSISKQLIFN
jgi:hypothetical protein